jgi:hypothetical protein
MDEVDAKRLARVTLCAMAERARGKMSAMEWEDSVEDTPEGKLLGAKEVDAIGSLIFGKNTKRRR